MKKHTWLVVLALCGAGCADASRSEAEAAASSWTAQHSEGWTLEVARTMPIQGFQFGPTNGECSNGQLWITARTGAADLDLFFNCPQNDVVDLAWLKANLRSYSLDPLPVSIGADGWRFLAYPTSSSLTEGLTFESWADGRVAMRIETPLFSIVGEDRSNECVQASMIADGGNPDCFVTVPFEGPLVLNLNVPLDRTTFLAPVPTRPR